MLSLGESFDPLLTARENAVTAAILAGYTKREALEQLPAMAAFAELEESLDEPLRTYSAGMTLRLAFAVAVSSKPDVLLVDEVLAVGDLRFQSKCLNRIRELQEGGTAILLASHDEGQIRSTCQRVLWLDRGAVRALGEPDEAYGPYRSALRAADEPIAPVELATPRLTAHGELTHGKNRFGTLATEIVEVRIDPDVAVPATATNASPVRIELDLLPHTPAENPIVGISLWRVRDGAKVLDVSTAGDGVHLGLIDRPTTVVIELDRVDAEPGRYRLDVGLYEAEWRATYDYHWHAYPMEVVQRGGATFGPPRRWRIG
jgi:lipopolysaccharide transport system ATP-binding protein